MGFSIKLQKNKSEKNKIGKSLTDVITLNNCTLKDDTSIINPIIIANIQSTIDIVNCNYMTIQQFNRTYFINDIRFITSKIVEFSCHVDVLESYKDSIRSNNAIIRRQENKYNLYLNDGVFKVYQNPLQLVKYFPVGLTSESYLLAVAGGSGNSSA